MPLANLLQFALLDRALAGFDSKDRDNGRWGSKDFCLLAPENGRGAGQVLRGNVSSVRLKDYVGHCYHGAFLLLHELPEILHGSARCP